MSRTKLFIATGIAALAFTPAANAASSKQAPASKQNCKKGQKKGKCGPPAVKGRMTGHGTTTTSKGIVKYEFRNTICGSEALPDLKVSRDTDRLDFRLTAYNSRPECFERFPGGEGHPVAGFDSMRGTGTGTLNGVPGATVSFQFTDRGEPGRSDLATITIMAPNGGGVVLSITDSPSDLGGNIQAHKSNQ